MTSVASRLLIEVDGSYRPETVRPSSLSGRQTRSRQLNEQKPRRVGAFDLLTPDVVTDAVESVFSLRLDGMLVPCPSYINRVYGIRDEEEIGYIVKFYRPGRWEDEAIREEHRFLLDCADSELPVVVPIHDSAGETLHFLELGSNRFPFALFPKMGGRNFDPESDDQWRRIGALSGRLHQAARRRSAPARATCHPELIAGFVAELLADEVVHPDAGADFESVCTATLAAVEPMFEGVELGRVHGDLHRGNILDRPGTGLIIFDFDDMMQGPPVQDLWLLLPGRVNETQRELALLLDAYEEFTRFDHSTLRLIEPLRFMRMVYFLAWRSRQRNDYWFRESFPDWGSKAFWLKEVEDLRDQADVIAEVVA